MLEVKCFIKIILLIIIVTTSSGILTGCKSSNSNDYVVSAKNKRNNPKGYSYEDVLKDYNEAIKLDPNNVEAYNGRGDLLYRPKVSLMFDNSYNISQGTDLDIPNQDAAIDDFNKAIEIKPNAESYLKRAYSKIAENVATTRKYGRQDSGISHSCLGVSEDIDKAISLEPNYSDAYYLKTNCQEELHNYDIGHRPEYILEGYNKAIEIDRNNILAYSSRARIKHFDLEDDNGALSDLDKVVEIDNSNPDSFINRAFYKDRFNDKRGAIADYEQAIKLSQERGEYHRVKSAKISLRRIKSNL